MKQYGIFILMALASTPAWSQITIGSNVEMAASGTPDIAVEGIRDITNNSGFDFSATNFRLGLISGDQNVNGNWTVSELHVSGGTNKNINGTVTVTQGISFATGILNVSNSGKLLFTGSADNLTGASDNSYVSGPFTVRNSSRLDFPVGAVGIGYVPLTLESGSDTDEISVEVINNGANLTPEVNDPSLLQIDNSRYWQITSTGDIAVSESRVSLSMKDIVIDANLSPVVVEADQTGGSAFSLGSASFDAMTITSSSSVTRSILAVGGSEEILVVIHDIITPYTTDEVNDHLYIENIGKFPVNKVTLLDRWGGPVKEWTNFRNYSDAQNPNNDGYDFSALTPGSYICVAEYGNDAKAMKKSSQMVTVLKAK